MIDLNAWWKEDKCPIRNGIMFRDGTYFPISVEVEDPYSWPTRAVEIIRQKPTILDDVGEGTSIGGHPVVKVGNPVVKVGNPVVKVGNGYALCGEGSLGDEGYVALTDERDDLIWIAYFDRSNPFVSILVDGTVITATSNLEWEWSFPREEPQRFWITLPTSPQ